MSSTFGNYLRVTTFGESHGTSVGAVLDGFPANIRLTEDDIQTQLNRRRPGQSGITTPRSEADTVKILSGVDNGLTLGTPIAFAVNNKDQRPGDYSPSAAIPRPSHADYAYTMKYGISASSGGGRASARETVGRVAAGAAAEIFLRERFGVDIIAFVSSVGSITAPVIDDFGGLTRGIVDKNPVRCPDEKSAAEMERLIKDIKSEGDSTGGVITCVCRDVPAGWGEPVFGKLEALLAQAMMSIPAARGFEIGSGFAAASMRGSEHNDLFIAKNGGIGTKTNRSGGIQGGISNGETIYFRVAFKPTATIGREQETADYQGNMATLKPAGRHDPCVVPRAVPVVESMAALVLGDMALSQARLIAPQ
ncbi:MAG: chorismate synthase [Chitinispirillia bacterium]|nr:chorismate synthase [Chitinispirillia bacterium]MCL2268200.1 chorismate synthase [Chitinispirillia bacterium]